MNSRLQLLLISKIKTLFSNKKVLTLYFSQATETWLKNSLQLNACNYSPVKVNFLRHYVWIMG